MSSVPACPPLERQVQIGKVVKIRGLRGDLKILPLTWNPDHFNDLEGLWFHKPDGSDEYHSLKRVRVDGAIVFVRLKDCPTRELAEPLVGSELFIDEEFRADLPENRYYIDDLVGCQVKCRKNGALGRLDEVMEMPANDVWVVHGEKGEILVPAIKSVVVDVQVEAKAILVELPEGLMPEDVDKE